MTVRNSTVSHERAAPDVDTIYERIRQAMACVDAIDYVLLDREVYPDQDQMPDRVLQGLASAAGELLRQTRLSPAKELHHG